MKIKITGKKFIHISEDNLLTKGQAENIPIEIPRYYNDLDLKDSIFIMKSVNSDGIYIECPLSVTEYGVQKIYLTWNTSPIITACEGQIGFQLLVQSADKVVLYQSFVGYAIVNNGILLSDSKNFSKDTLEEYLKSFRKIYDEVKTVGELVPKNVVTKGYFENCLKNKADKTQLQDLPKKDDILLKNDAKKIFETKQNKNESSKSAQKIDGIEKAGLSSYYGTDKNGKIGFHKLVLEGTGGSDVDMSLYYDKQQVENLLNTKPNKESVYEKTDVDALLEKKAEKHEAYTKEEANRLLEQKVENKDVYNKAFVDKKLDQKADLIGGVVPTEQLPPLGLGEKENRYKDSYCFPSKATNSIVGNKNTIEGKGCVCVGEQCFASGENAVAVSGNTYGFLSYDNNTQFIALDESYDQKNMSGINEGDSVVLVSHKGKSVIATVLEKKTNNIKTDKEPPADCKVVLVPAENKVLATAKGINSLACGTGAIAKGRFTKAVSDFSIAIGDMATAKGIASIGMGRYCDAEAPYSVCLGSNCSARGGVAVGNSCDAIGKNSTSIGHYCYADELGATAIGSNNNALGQGSFCAGMSNTAMYGQTVVGICAVPSSAQPDVFSAISEAFIVGSSHDKSTPANAFRVDFNGQVYAGAFNNTGADYAEFFEWEDENSNEEDRVGLFVTPKKEKVRTAMEEDYVIGAVSGNAGVIGNNPMEWNQKYLKDDFGRLLYQKNKDTNEITLKINPKWDKLQPYTQRANRKEWACVGMLGKIKVRDNGNCKVGGFCTVGSEETQKGIAVPAKPNSAQKWYVTKRISNHIIEIIFK